MRIEQLLHLKDLNETNSITQTAQKFYMSQQGLSNSIKSLEKEYNLTLLKRSNQGVSLTSDGQLFLQKAEKLIDEYIIFNNYFKSISEQQDNIENKIVIACHPGLLDSFLIEIIDSAKTIYPDIPLTVIEKGKKPIQSLVEDDIAQFAISRVSLPKNHIPPYKKTLVDENNINYDLLFSDSCVCCCKHSHPLAHYRSLSLEEIKEYPLITFESQYKNPAIFPLGPDISLNTSAFFSNDISFHKSLLKRGLAISLMSSFEYRKVYSKIPYLTAIPIHDQIEIIFFLVHKSVHQLSFSSKKILELLSSYDFLKD